MIAFHDICLQYSSKILFDGLNGVIESKNRIGLVGPNGAGKSTFLKLLMGLTDSDRGVIEKANFVTVGYLPQDGLDVRGRSLFKEVESAFEHVLGIQANIEEASKKLEFLDAASEGYAQTLELIGGWEHRLEELEVHSLQSKIEKILLGLGFSVNDMNRDTSEFSGGWQMRIALAKLLLKEPSVLLLDEPTNHLDLDSLQWLEGYLQNYEGAIVLVSHDRAFLDGLTNRTFALSRGKLEVYAGNYSYFERESQVRKEHLKKAYLNQQKELEQTQRFIDRFRAQATKARQVQSRIKAMEKIERITIEEEDDEIHFSFPAPPRSGHVSLELVGVSKSYGENKVLKDVSLKVERGERIAVVGVNGAGKSTLSRILAGVESFEGGERIVGHKVELSYFAQHQAAELDSSKDVLSIVEEIATGDRNRARTLLGAFLFHGDDVFKKVSVLSGGEKNRLALAKMLLQPFNCLILDEPTNHLDMKSKSVLHRALHEFEGTFIVVSHDRDFIDPLINKVWEVSPHGIRVFLGNVSHYIEKIQAEKESDGSANARLESEASSKNRTLTAKERRQQKAAFNKKILPLKKEIQALEAAIAVMESKYNVLEQAMLDPAFFKQGNQTKQSMDDYDVLKQKIERSYAKWELLIEQINTLEPK